MSYANLIIGDSEDYTEFQKLLIRFMTLIIDKWFEKRKFQIIVMPIDC